MQQMASQQAQHLWESKADTRQSAPCHRHRSLRYACTINSQERLENTTETIPNTLEEPYDHVPYADAWLSCWKRGNKKAFDQ